MTQQRAALIGALTLVLCALVPVTRDSESLAQDRATVDELHRRVRSYYAALEQRDFTVAWKFFDATMRRDTPKAAYAANLKSAFGHIQLAQPPEAWKLSESADKLRRPRGEAVATLNLAGPRGEKLPPAQDRTYWVWERTSADEQPTWHLVGGSMTALGAVPNGAMTPSASPGTRP
jgi:hypothetical protein